MRVLLIHTDSFRFHVTGETSVARSARALGEADREGSSGEALVAFVAAEEGDERGLESVADQAAAEVLRVAGEVAAPAVWVYPYAHLSSHLAAPRVAQKLLDMVEERVRKGAGERAVHRAPFGYYKAFEIACKGHPLSELALTLVPKADGEGSEETGCAAHESEALKKEKELRSTWLVIRPGESEPRPVEGFDWKQEPGLHSFFQYEHSGTRAVGEPPPHIKLMRELELVDYEPGSDAGNMRWYPNGYLFKKLLEDRVDALMGGYGAMQVETPIMYDHDHPHLSKYLNRFPARQYLLRSDKRDFFLRFAACFGQYLMMHDGQLSYRHLPARYYELTHSSFRREQSGELAGLRRLRSFTMPDMHTLVRDEAAAVADFLGHVRLARQWLEDIGIEVQVAIRFVDDFYRRHPGLAAEVASIMGRPVLLEIWSQRFFYFVAKFECNFVDTSGKAACLSTTQIDVENAERFEIRYVDEQGERQHPLIMHTSVPGAIERNLYALLETQSSRMASGKKAELPFWLAPTQLRVIPVGKDHLEAAEALVSRCRYRTDLDDRVDESLGKRIRWAEKAWVPFIAVLGDKEIESGSLNVRVRGQKDPLVLPLEELETRLGELQGSRPWRPLAVPRHLSRRPIFVG